VILQDELSIDDPQLWILLHCCFAGLIILVLTVIFLLFKLWKTNQLNLKMMKLLRKDRKEAEIKSNTRWHSQENQNLDSSFEEESQAEHSNLNNLFEPVIVFTQNPYYDEDNGNDRNNLNNETEENDKNGGNNETRGTVTISQNQENINGSSQNDPTIIFTSNPYYE
jgi:hypothetical protein